MPKAPLVRTRVFPYHVYGRSNNQDWFHLPTPEMWEIFLEIWSVVSSRYNLKLHAFVLMSNHFHALVSTPDANLDQAMLYLMREVAREVNRRTGRINHVFGGPYKWSLISSQYHYWIVLKYVYRNPVDAGICSRVEAYPFSTLPGRNQFEATTFEIIDSIFDSKELTKKSPATRLDWLNEDFKLETKQCIRYGLRRSRFKPRTTNVTAATKREFEPLKKEGGNSRGGGRTF